jgi:hypothetical protein
MADPRSPQGNWRRSSKANTIMIRDVLCCLENIHPKSVVYQLHSVRSLQVLMSDREYVYPDGSKHMHWGAHIWENTTNKMRALVFLRGTRTWPDTKPQPAPDPSYCLTVTRPTYAMAAPAVATTPADALDELNELCLGLSTSGDPPAPLEILNDQIYFISVSLNGDPEVLVECPTDDAVLIEIWKLALQGDRPFVTYAGTIPPVSPFDASPVVYRWTLDPH